MVFNLCISKSPRWRLLVQRQRHHQKTFHFLMSKVTIFLARNSNQDIYWQTNMFKIFIQKKMDGCVCVDYQNSSKSLFETHNFLCVKLNFRNLTRYTSKYYTLILLQFFIVVLQNQNFIWNCKVNSFELIFLKLGKCTVS